MIEKKSFKFAIKRALETGTFNFVGQEATAFPDQIWRIDELKIEDQNWWECNPISKIDVSNNEIPSIPEGIIALPDVQLLRMKNNLVTQFPKHLVKLQNLKSVDLSRNKVQAVPPEIGYAPALVQLNLSQNLITVCPNLSSIKTLQVVYLNHNKIKEMPNLGQNVKKAEVQENQIGRICKQNFFKCRSLQSLNLGKNMIEMIEEGSFSNVQSLVILQMKENRLNSFKQLPKSEKLDTLSLGFNRMTQFSYFDRCPNLTVLILSDNKIKSLSRDIYKLKKLKTLDISNNDLPDLPCEIGFINSLVRIQLEGNPLKSMRQNIRTGGTNVVKKYLQDRMDPKERDSMEKSQATTFEKVSQGQYWSKLLYQFTQNGQLILRKMNLTQLDQMVFEKNLKGINVSDNKISNISNNICKLQLKYLIVNNNNFSTLPLTLERIESLAQIQAKSNNLVDFCCTSPYGFPSLNYLDLSGNKIKQIPEGILMLPKLRTLHLSYNNIVDAEPLWNPKILTDLQILDLCSNKILDISDNVYCRVGLNYLNIENNNMSKIPTVLGFMKLSGLKIDGNPLKLIKRAVIDKGTDAILDHLQTKHVGNPPPPQLPKQTVKAPQYVSEKPSYPYETEQKLQNEVVKKNDKEQKEKEKEIKFLEGKIKMIMDELDNAMSMNNMTKTQKKKEMQSLMVQRNKLMKGD